MNTTTDNPTAAARRFLHVWTTMLGLTDRPDRPRVEQLVKDAYRAAGLRRALRRAFQLARALAFYMLLALRQKRALHALVYET
ncbi:hypothetical protein [Magnetospirillum sp. UT-4]|uniref:hypothetical protein n=1 Tax=Magnetospirillum sp. UT-4 TaxID=2681467 RepID=UPI00138225CF|nr:hypothetical protein [Magnetospirillum sp. UT-4]CAA7615021.1 hypothetical protein MTBUT4_20026 [Magnetospirillum sp. UT-4]